MVEWDGVVVLWWKKREVAKEFAAARGGVVLYGTNGGRYGGTESRAGFFFLPAFDLRLVGMMRSAKGRGGGNRNTPLTSFELLGLREVGGYSTGVNNGRIR